MFKGCVVCFQVLSQTVAFGFRYYGIPGTESTQKFITYMDKFFDCLNVSNKYTGYRKRKPFLYPYKGVADPEYDPNTEDPRFDVSI